LHYEEQIDLIVMDYFFQFHIYVVQFL